jgi:PEP-CTERM/exosortase A-associated glycosyltransferase
MITGLKVLHVLDHSLPVHSGYAFRTQALLSAQKRKGWNPIAVTSPKHYGSFNGTWRDAEQIGEIRYYRTPKTADGRLPVEGEARVMAALAKRIRAVIEQEHPSIIHAHTPILNAIPALRVSRKLGIPFVYEIRTLWEDAAVDTGKYGPRSWKYKAVRWLETWICRQASCVTVISQGLREDFIKRGIPAEQIRVIPNGVDVRMFRPPPSDASKLSRWNFAGKKIVGYVGSFFPFEGLDLLVDAIARLSPRRPDIGLLLVGGGDTEPELKAQIKRLKLESNVAIAGALPQSEIPEIYSLIDVLVYPRRSMRLTELVTPLKPLEAMAMGKAVVASDVGGHRELIEDGQTGILFHAGDVTALAEAIERTVDDVDLRRELGRRGTEWVSRERSWDNTTSAYAQTYAAALGTSEKQIATHEIRISADDQA